MSDVPVGKNKGGSSASRLKEPGRFQVTQEDLGRRREKVVSWLSG